MNNSDNSATPKNQMAHLHELNLWLPEFLTPSLNRVLGKHWTTLSKEKQRTSQHLDSALLASPATHSMLITLLAVANSSSMPSEEEDSFQTTIRRQLKSRSDKLRPKQKPKKEPPSELPSDKQQQGDYKGEKPYPCQDKF
jgi:hypothetical protein